MPDWTYVWQERITNLLSRRFLGFWGVLVLSYFRPDIVAQLILIYGILVGGPVALEAVKSKKV